MCLVFYLPKKARSNFRYRLFCSKKRPNSSTWTKFVTSRSFVYLQHSFLRRISTVSWEQSKEAFKVLVNKNAGYHRYILRLTNLIKMQLWKMKTFYPRKKTIFPTIFSNFSNVQRFLFFFLPNKPHIEGWEHIFSKKYHIIRILHQICYLQRF